MSDKKVVVEILEDRRFLSATLANAAAPIVSVIATTDAGDPSADETPPTATLKSSDLTKTGQNTIAIHMTYKSASGIDADSIYDWGVTVAGPDDEELAVTLGDVVQNSDGSVTAEYDVQKDWYSHNFNANDNGTYTVAIEDDVVSDVNGVGNVGQTLGTFDVNIAKPPGGIHRPAATLNADDLTSQAIVEQLFDVKYDGENGIDENTIWDGSVTVTAPDGSQMWAMLVDSTVNADGSVTGHYSVQKDDHAQFTSVDNGQYIVSVEPDGVSDNEGTTVAAGVIGRFQVNVAAPAAGAAPTAVLQVSDLSGNDTTAVLRVTYSGQDPIAKQTIDDNDLVLTNTDGSTQTAFLVSTTKNADGSITAEYHAEFWGAYPLAATAGSTAKCAVNTSTGANADLIIGRPIFAPQNINGTYTVSLQSNQVSDTQGRTAAAATLGSFKVDITVQNPYPYMFATAGPITAGATGAARHVTTTPSTAKQHTAKSTAHPTKKPVAHKKKHTTQAAHTAKKHKKHKKHAAGAKAHKATKKLSVAAAVQRFHEGKSLLH